MDKYDFAKTWSDDHGVRINCTDNTELEWITSTIKNASPNATFSFEIMVPGEPYFTHIKNVPNAALLWWVIKQLCSRGWEPLGAASYVYDNYAKTDFHYQFRRKNSVSTL